MIRVDRIRPIGASHAVSALAKDDSAGDQMRGPQRFRDPARDRESLYERFSIAKRKACALDKKPLEGFHRTGLFNQAPLARSSGDMVEERTPDRAQVRMAARDHDHRNAKRIMEPVEIDHVETRNSDPLQEHRMELGIEARTPNQAGEHPGRVVAVPPYFSADDPNQRLSRVDRTHDEHVAPMSLAEGGIIEADDMGEKPRQGTTPLSREVQTTFRSRKRSHTHHLVPDLSFGWDKNHCAIGTHFNGQAGGVNCL